MVRIGLWHLFGRFHMLHSVGIYNAIGQWRNARYQQHHRPGHGNVFVAGVAKCWMSPLYNGVGFQVLVLQGIQWGVESFEDLNVCPRLAPLLVTLSLATALRWRCRSYPAIGSR